MGEMAEYWKDISPVLKEMSKQRRCDNRDKSVARLNEAGIPYVTKDGNHLIIQLSIGRIDFWPSTGLFKGAVNGRGVFNLIAAINGRK